MKSFSKHWKGSTKPRKQRKYVAHAPLHIKHTLLSANLAKTLRTKYKRRNIPVRTGDKVKIMVGQFKGKTGKVERVDTKKTKIYVEGMQLLKRDGTKVAAALHPSNVQIQELFLDDKERKAKLEIKLKA